MTRTAAAGHGVDRCFASLYTFTRLPQAPTSTPRLWTAPAGRESPSATTGRSQPSARLSAPPRSPTNETLIVVVAVAEPYQAAESRSRPTSTGLRPPRRRHHLDEARPLLSERGLSVETLQMRGDPAKSARRGRPTMPTSRSSGAAGLNRLQRLILGSVSSKRSLVMRACAPSSCGNHRAPFAEPITSRRQAFAAGDGL